MINLSRVVIILSFLLFSFSAQSSTPPKIIINEIAWMGTETSSTDEWIELYNNENFSINLKGWTLKSANKNLIINLTGTISANEFYLLERTNDETLPNIKADLIYKGSLNNQGEDLKLINSSEKIVDEVNCSSKWFAGNNKTKQTMERLASKEWQTSSVSGGTPKIKNSLGVKIKKSAEISEQSVGNLSFPLFVASILAIFSGTIILFLKKKIKRVD